jgi:hypothetical protein
VIPAVAAVMMEGQEEVAEKDYGEFCGIEAL